MSDEKQIAPTLIGGATLAAIAFAAGMNMRPAAPVVQPQPASFPARSVEAPHAVDLHARCAHICARADYPKECETCKKMLGDQ